MYCGLSTRERCLGHIRMLFRGWLRGGIGHLLLILILTLVRRKRSRLLIQWLNRRGVMGFLCSLFLLDLLYFELFLLQIVQRSLYIKVQSVLRIITSIDTHDVILNVLRLIENVTHLKLMKFYLNAQIYLKHLKYNFSLLIKILYLYISCVFYIVIDLYVNYCCQIQYLIF